MTDVTSIRDVSTLKERIGEGFLPGFLFFWGHRPRPDGCIGKSCFRQWWPQPFMVEGVTYPTAEHFMMAEKARLFGDASAFLRVLESRSPAQAKKIGRQARPFDESRWVKRRRMRNLMEKQEQRKRAEDFKNLHHEAKLLVLPNIWDPLGARLLVELGYPAVATASWSVAHSLGYGDGQRIRLSALLDVVRRIVAHVDVPVSVDAESGYAEKPADVAENLRRIVQAGAVGVNLEDSIVDEGQLYPTDLQCDRIRAVRRMAEQEGVPLWINARTDVFLRNTGGSRDENLALAIERGRAYLEAGADSFYPIPVGDLSTLGELRRAIDAPINVLAGPSAAPMKALEAAGISRLSLGPGFLKACLRTMKKIAVGLQGYGSYELFTEDVLGNDEIRRYVSQERMR